MPGEIHSIMTADLTGKKLVEFARLTADQLVRQNLTRTQIRNIFTEVRKIESLWDSRPDDALRRLNMLRPKLAYAAKRYEPVSHLRDVLDEAIQEVDSAPADERNQRFDRLVDLFEAILAYHRAMGGRS